ncbi:MAG TPA: rRNA maturation RNase YbeY [Rudaea sp.]|nr:rRNA maturation RNase YbeY [Rudaea sp.]
MHARSRPAKKQNGKLKAVAIPIVSVEYGLPRRGVPSAASFRQWVAAAAIGARRRKPIEVSIRLIDATQGRELNHRYRQRDYATNVLSFPAELPNALALPLIGDLAICVPVVAREATEQGKSVRNHFAHLTVHGVLHLLGYDHENAADAQRMETLEVRILATLGIADPYQ